MTIQTVRTGNGLYQVPHGIGRRRPLRGAGDRLRQRRGKDRRAGLGLDRRDTGQHRLTGTPSPAAGLSAISRRPGAARPATNTGRRHRYPYGRLHVSQAHHIIAAAGQIHSAVFLLSCHPQQHTYLYTARYAVPSPRLPGSHLRPAAEKPPAQAQTVSSQPSDTPTYLPF